MAANGIRVGDVSISLGKTKTAITDAVLASKKHYSLRGGGDDLLTILSPTGSLVAFVRFRNQQAIGIETIWSADSASDLSGALSEIVHTLIGDAGSLSFYMKPNSRTQVRFSASNVTIDLRPIGDVKNGGAGGVAVFVTVGEVDESIK